MDDREFNEALREIESLPDTNGNGLGTPREQRNEQIEFAYKRRDLFKTLLTKAHLSLEDVEDEIKRLIEEERVELASGRSLPGHPLRRHTDNLLEG